MRALGKFSFMLLINYNYTIRLIITLDRAGSTPLITIDNANTVCARVISLLILKTVESPYWFNGIHRMWISNVPTNT